MICMKKLRSLQISPKMFRNYILIKINKNIHLYFILTKRKKIKPQKIFHKQKINKKTNKYNRKWRYLIPGTSSLAPYSR